jgi:hypothetical protein
MRRASILLCFVVTFLVPMSAAQSGASDEPAANPARPTVSTPATLTPVGYLQFETGFLGANTSPGLSSQYSFNEVTKIAIAPRLQLLASSEPFARSTAGGDTSNAAGDVSLGAQAVLFAGDGAVPTLAASYFHRVYAGDAPDLDSGSPANSFLLLASADVKEFHYDANAMFNDLSMGQSAERSSANLFPCLIPSVRPLAFPVKFGTSRSPFSTGMPSEICGPSATRREAISSSMRASTAG